MARKDLNPILQAPDMLVYSAEKGRFLEVRRLVIQGEYTQDTLNKAMLAATENTQIDCLNFLLDQGADAKCREAIQALSFIARKGDLKHVWLFLDKGAEGATSAGVELLLMACVTGDLKLVRELVRLGAVMSANIALKALVNAAKQGHVEVVRIILFASGLDLREEASVAMKEAAMNDQWGVVQFLMRAGADSASALRCAGAKGKRGTTQKLLDMGCNPSRGLAAAASSGNLKVVKEILNRGVLPEAGAHALKEAARFGHTDVARELLKVGVDPKCGTSKEALTLASAAFEQAQRERKIFEERWEQTQMWEEVPDSEKRMKSEKLNALWKRELSFQDIAQIIASAQDPDKIQKGTRRHPGRLAKFR